MESLTEERIISFHRALNNADDDDLSGLESRFHKLKTLIEKQGEEKSYNVALEILQYKLVDLKKEQLHKEEINELDNARKNLESKVLNIQTPIFINPGSVFEDLKKDVKRIEGQLDRHKDNCLAIYNLRQAVKDVKDKIESLEEDNTMALAWFGTSTTLTAASIGVAFIPVVGLPIAGLMNAVPYLGQLTHRLVVSHKRKKKFT